MNTERRTSILSYLIPRRRVGSRPRHRLPKEPLRSRWYVPWLAAALALAGLIAGAIAALELVTAIPQAPPTMPLGQPAHVEERVSEVEPTTTKP